MNRKGFTLIEVLATIVIISILGAVAYTGVTSYIKTSKEKAEDKFLDEIKSEIDSYISLNSAALKQVGEKKKFDKVVVKKGGTSKTNQAEVKKEAFFWQVKIYDAEKKDFVNLKFGDLITNLKMTDKFQNPNTGKICSNDINIEIYKDSDHVYYYCVNMKEATTGCPSSKNIDTRSDELKKIIGETEICEDYED